MQNLLFIDQYGFREGYSTDTERYYYQVEFIWHCWANPKLDLIIFIQ